MRAAPASPEGKCGFLFALGSAFPPGFLTALHYAFPFHLGACLKESGKEGRIPTRFC